MDTKSKKRKMAVSFGIFFLSISLLLVSGMLLAKQCISDYCKSSEGFLGLMEQDYQNTGEFRIFMQERLSDFLAMASDGNWSAARSDKYHEAVCEDKNLRYRIISGDRERYSNMDGLQWDENSGKLPEGYNFKMVFDGAEVSIQKDGAKQDVYGDGYYRGGSQWYVPGYKNFTADDGMKNVKVIMLAAQEPLSYSYVRYQEGGYMQTQNRLYDIAQRVSENHKMMRMGMLGLAAGVLLLLFSLFFWKEKRKADDRIAAFTGKIWFEGKLLAFLLLLAGLHAAAGAGSGYGHVMEDAFSLAEMGTAVQLETAEESQSYTNASDWNQLQEAEVDEVHNQVAFTDTAETGAGISDWIWNLKWNLWNVIDALASHPGMLLVFFWTAYFLANDIRRNRGHVLHGIFRRIAQEVRTKDLKQPFAVQEMHRFLLMAASGMLSAAAMLVFMVLRTQGLLDSLETVIAVSLILSLLAAVAIRCLLCTRQEAAALDSLADYIWAVQGGDYAKQADTVQDSSLKPLFDSLSQIRQGMETAVADQLRSERMKVELVANVSHDLKTPLTSIISYLEFLKQEEGLPEHVQDYIRILDEKAGRLHTIVQDVFAVSKAASGQLPVEIKKLDFGKLLRQTLADMDEQIQASNVRIITDIPAEPVLILADGARLYRVFQNLIQNALQYSMDGTRVFVNLCIEGDDAQASVKNISRQELHAGMDFTERFMRGDQSRTDGGAGLGLSIAKSFTEACGGRFMLETDADLFIVRAAFRREAMSLT